MKRYLANNYSYLLFFILLGGISFLYNYQELVAKRPQSIHKWRQADGASIALNYYQGGMNFFEPEVHNLTSDQGTSGKCYPSEVPFFYYGVACFYKLFGYHEWIYRALNTLLFFLGLFFLFRTLLFLLNDVFWAIGLPLLLFTSPVLVYYANNYPVNATALALTLIAWYYFIRFLFDRKKKWFGRWLLFFFLAASLKVTALFSLAAFGFIFLIELTGLKKFGGNAKLFSWRPMLWIGLVFICIAAWLKFVGSYNERHDCAYFSTTIFPYWSLGYDEIQYVIDTVKNVWLTEYFHLSVLFFLAACFVFTLMAYKKNLAVLNVCVLVILAEVLVYVVLQFRQFGDHDYYVIDLFILPVLIFLSAFYILKQRSPRVFSSVILKGAFVIFVALNVLHARARVNERYEGAVNDYPANKDFYTLTPYLRQIGITEADTVIAIPDFTHVSLYLMNQKGWTEYTDMRFNQGEPVPYNADSAGIQNSINKGARYLVLNGIEELYKKPYLQPFATCLVGRYNRILIFKLKDKKDNFSVNRRALKQRFFCDAELRSDDKEHFKGLPDTARFAFGRTQTDSLAHSGKYSCRLDKKDPYGMTIRIKGALAGESFVINAWRKNGVKINGTMIVSTDAGFYNNQYKEMESAAGWQKISKELFITKEHEGQEFVIYLLCDGDAPVLFDDMEILWYKRTDNLNF